jgi:hypothetical protein
MNIQFDPMFGISPARGLKRQQRPSEAILGNDLFSCRHGLLSAQFRCASAWRLEEEAPSHQSQSS